MFHSQPVPEELQNGESFGYIIAFRAFGEVSWTHVATSAPGASRYVYRNDSIAPFSPFHVKVGTYNSKGQGPFSPVVTIYSAEIGEERILCRFFECLGEKKCQQYRREGEEKIATHSTGRLIASKYWFPFKWPRLPVSTQRERALVWIYYLHQLCVFSFIQAGKRKPHCVVLKVKMEDVLS